VNNARGVSTCVEVGAQPTDNKRQNPASFNRRALSPSRSVFALQGLEVVEEAANRKTPAAIGTGFSAGPENFLKGEILRNLLSLWGW
jgi:hypothetical protein